jgi:hypothetical protein
MSYWTQEAERRSRLPKSSVWLRPLSEGEGRLVQAKKEKIARAIRKAHAIGPVYSVPPAASAKSVERKSRRFITNRMVEKMRELDAHMTRAQIAKECGVARCTVTRVLGWKHYHRRGRLGMRAE